VVGVQSERLSEAAVRAGGRTVWARRDETSSSLGFRKDERSGTRSARHALEPVLIDRRGISSDDLHRLREVGGAAWSHDGRWLTLVMQPKGEPSGCARAPARREAVPTVAGKQFGGAAWLPVTINSSFRSGVFPRPVREEDLRPKAMSDSTSSIYQSSRRSDRALAARGLRPLYKDCGRMHLHRARVIARRRTRRRCKPCHERDLRGVGDQRGYASFEWR